MEPCRFDTRFYVAVLPDQQQARDLSGETDHAEWTQPRVALEQADAGALALMPPTRSMLMELADLTGTADVLAAACERVIAPVLPKLVRTPAGWSFRYPSRA